MRTTAWKQVTNRPVRVQMLVNQQILTKLDQLGKRLDKLENTGWKKTLYPGLIKSTKTTKTSSPKKKSSSKSVSVHSATHLLMTPTLPSLVELRQNATIQEQVQQRLEELTRLSATGIDAKIKSQRGGVDIFVKNRIRWPHEHVLSGSNKERVSYDQLTVLQWVTGFCRTIKEEQNSKLREHMLDYMVALLEDAQDFSWGVAKASHAVLLCRMEPGEIRYFSESEKIEEQMLKDTCHKVKVKLKIMEPNLDKNIAKPCHVSSSTRIHVVFQKHIKQKRYCTDMFAQHV